jgi:glycosyltransferase involved in cell wall biosynthesis
MAEVARIAAFARLASRPIPRVVRMAGVARELGYRPLFCGARRDADLPREDQWQGLPILRVGPHFPLLNGRRPWFYLRSVLAYNRALYRLLRQQRPAIVHASDIETMPAAACYRLFNRCRLVYNIHDNVAQRYDFPALPRAILNLLEGCCVLRSDVTLVPEEFRREALPRWCRRRVSVVRNTPGDIAAAPPPPVDGRIRIFFGGWLDWGRGLRALLEIADAHEHVELRIAGEGSDEIVRELRAHPRVRYLGFLDHDAVIEETRRCHVVPALYDPARVINRFAASNKLAEALAIGRPVLLNAEMEIARQFEGSSCAITGRYAGIAESWPRVERLLGDRHAYREACAEARRQFEQRYAWAPVRRAMIAALAPEAREG